MRASNKCQIFRQQSHELLARSPQCAGTLSGNKALMELGSSRVPFSAALIALLSLERIFALINRSLNRFMLIVTSTSSLFPRGGTKVHSVLAHEAKFREVGLCAHLNRRRLQRELFPAAVKPDQLLSGAPAAGEPLLPHHLHQGSLPHASSQPSWGTQR